MKNTGRKKYTKCTLKWHRLAKGTGCWRDVRSVQGQESVRLLFRLRTDSAGLLEDRKSCRMVSDERCVCVVRRMWLISWWGVGNLREIGWCC